MFCRSERPSSAKPSTKKAPMSARKHPPLILTTPRHHPHKNFLAHAANSYKSQDGLSSQCPPTDNPQPPHSHPRPRHLHPWRDLLQDPPPRHRPNLHRLHQVRHLQRPWYWYHRCLYHRQSPANPQAHQLQILRRHLFPLLPP